MLLVKMETTWDEAVVQVGTMQRATVDKAEGATTGKAGPGGNAKDPTPGREGMVMAKEESAAARARVGVVLMAEGEVMVDAKANIGAAQVTAPEAWATVGKGTEWMVEVLREPEALEVKVAGVEVAEEEAEEVWAMVVQEAQVAQPVVLVAAT